MERDRSMGGVMGFTVKTPKKNKKTLAGGSTVHSMHGR